MSAIKKLVQFNRRLTRQFVDYCSQRFGVINHSEQVFYNELRGRSFNCVIEIGGANRPLFSKNSLKSYIGIDIDKSFDWHSIYSEYYVQSCEDDFPDKMSGDLIVSKYVLEHVVDNKKVFANIKKRLQPGGVSVHILPLGFHPFSLVNRLLGNNIAKLLIPFLRPGSEGITGYPAYYHYCYYGGLEEMFKNLKLKYKIEYFFGAEDYFGFFAPLGCFIHVLNRAAHLARCNILASNAVIVIYG